MWDLETEMNDVLVNDTRKAELLSNEVEHIDIKSFDARPIVDAMKKMSFTRATSAAPPSSTTRCSPIRTARSSW